MAKTIKVKVDVDTNSVQIANQDTLTLTQQVRELKKALQTVPEGTKEWTLIQQKYNETKDALDRVNVKSKELFGTMSALPGPIGNVAGQLDNTVGVLKTFSAIKFSDLKGQFAALAADFKEIGANLLKLTGITAVYNRTIALTGATAATASTGVKALAIATSALYTALGVGLILLLVEGGKAIYNMIDPTEKEAAALKNLKNAFNELDQAVEQGKKINDAYTKVMLANAKIRGASQKELDDISLAGAAKQKQLAQKSLTDAQNEEKTFQAIVDKKIARGKKATDDEQKALDDAKAKRVKANDDLRTAGVAETELVASIAERKIKNQEATTAKIAAELQKERDIRKAALETIAKNEKDALLSLLPEREQELRKIADDYREKIKYAEKFKEDTTILEIAMQEALRLKRAEYAAKDTEDFENNLKKRLDELDKENADKLEKDTVALELRKAQGLIGEEQFQGELFQIKLKYATSDIERQQAQIDFLEYGKEKQKEYADFIIKSNQAIADSWYALGDSTASIFRELANLFEEGSDAAKTFAIISVVINAATGISKIAANLGTQLSQYGVASAAATAAISEGTALLATPFTAPFGAALIAAGTANKALATKGALSAKLNAGLQIGAIAASSAVQIATITGANKASRPAGSSSSGGGSEVATPAFTAPTQAAAPNIEKSNVSSEGRIGQIVTGAATEQGKRPLQTYVVGSQVSSQQQLDRRISLSARMAG
jgi:hypothetical protein